MRRSVRRLGCALALLAVMSCGAYALSGGDSLISLNYLKETFLPKATAQGEEVANKALQGTYDKGAERLNGIQKELRAKLTGEGELSYSGDLRARDWRDGDQLALSTGSGLLMLEGAAGVTHNGAFIDVTAGAEVASGGRLQPDHRYLVGEDTQAQITVLSGAAQLGVQGSYGQTAGEGSATPFYDVSRDDWYYAPVDYVYGKQLFSGMDAHHFAPWAAMNRAMLMTVLYKMAGAPEDEMAAADAVFEDVPDSAWYASFVRWGASRGITAGTAPGRFSPEQQVTRQQVVVLLYSFVSNYLGKTPAQGADLSGYRDLDQVSDWAREAMAWAVAEGVVSSSSAGELTLSPQKQANRAEVAAMLRAFSEKIL